MNEELKQQIIEMLDKLTDEERLEIFHEYCVHCGSKNLPCYCMRDE